MFSCKYCGNFKINCFEEHLPTAVSIRCYFDTINLKQFGFYTTNSFEILVSERKFKNHFKNRESKTNIRQFSYTAYNADVMFYHEIPWFYQYFKSENLLLTQISNEERNTFTTLKVFMLQQVQYFYFLEAKFMNVLKTC